MKAPSRLPYAALATLALLSLAAAVHAQQRESRSAPSRVAQTQEQRNDAASPAATRPAGYSDRYAIIERNNIFVRDRSRPAPPSSPASTQPSRRSLEESLIVRGIAMEELGFRAYVEDLNKGATLRVSPGDPLGRGQVVAIALDAIQYEQDGRQRWIEIGSDLTGRESSVLPASSAASSSAEPSATTLPANVDLNDPNLSVEERMRLRRQLQSQRGR